MIAQMEFWGVVVAGGSIFFSSNHPLLGGKTGLVAAWQHISGFSSCACVCVCACAYVRFNKYATMLPLGVALRGKKGWQHIQNLTATCCHPCGLALTQVNSGVNL
jgi:hypothetical protein